MTDSPAVQAPLDPKEAPILDRVLSIRDKLSLLKQDKSTYIKSHDVLVLYDEVIEQVHLLNTVRQEHGKPLEQNRGIITLSPINAVGGASLIAISGQRIRRLLSIDIAVLSNHRT